MKRVISVRGKGSAVGKLLPVKRIPPKTFPSGITPLLVLIAAGGLSAFLHSCRQGHTGLAGRVETRVGEYHVVILNCNIMSVPVAERLEVPDQEGPVYRLQSCFGASILIRGNTLEINGRPYGMLQAGDTVMVDSSRVYVNGGERKRGAQSSL
jgi:hypothetical protein